MIQSYGKKKHLPASVYYICVNRVNISSCALDGEIFIYLFIICLNIIYFFLQYYLDHLGTDYQNV